MELVWWGHVTACAIAAHFISDPNTVALYDAQRFVAARDQMRYRLQWTLLAEMLPAPLASLLEVGCGTGILTDEVNQRPQPHP